MYDKREEMGGCQSCALAKSELLSLVSNSRMSAIGVGPGRGTVIVVCYGFQQIEQDRYALDEREVCD
jgi:hypothetical protein